MSTWDPNKARLDVARALSEIGSLYLDLWAEAEAKHADREMPGGEPMNLLGPAANLEAWEHRYEAAERMAMSTGDLWSTDAGGSNYGSDQLAAEDHPLLILATWEDAIREECDQPTDLRATVPRAIGYLRGKLDWMVSSDEHGDPQWLPVEALLIDLKAVQSTLEGVLRAGVRTDRGVDCPRCNEPLTHLWAGDHDNPKTIEDDHWRCSKCGESRPYRQYLKLVEAEYLDRATWLQADHMQVHYRIPAGTLKSWVHRGHVAKRYNVHSQRMVYRVIDALKMREDEETRKKKAGVA